MYPKVGIPTTLPTTRGHNKKLYNVNKEFQTQPNKEHIQCKSNIQLE